MFTVNVVDDEVGLDAQAHVRYAVYVEEKGWVPSSDAHSGREQDEYDPQSTHIVAHDLSGEAAGSLRIILGTGRLALPIELEPFGIARDPNRTSVEISRLAVKREYRGNQLVMLGLCRLAVQQMVLNNVDDCYALVERPLLRGLCEIGFPFREIGIAHDYFGGQVLPVHANVGELVPGVVAKDRFANFFTQSFENFISEESIR